MDDGHQQCASRRKGTLPNRTGKNSGKKPCKQSIEGSQGISFSSLSQIPLAQKLIIVTSALLLVFCLVPRVAQLSGTTGQPVSLHARSAKSDVREWRRRDDEPQRLYESGRHGRKEAAREPWDAAGIWDDDGAGPYEGGEMGQAGGAHSGLQGASSQQPPQLPHFNASIFEGTSKYPLFSGAYGSEAVNNLTAFRSAVWRWTEDTYRTHWNMDPEGVHRYDLFNPVITCPPGTQLQRYGEADKVLSGVGDGTKRLCLPLPAKEECAVYSFGSENRYGFEEAVLASTPCKVYTFDCTIDGHSVNKERHVYEKMCIGDPETAQTFSNVYTYSQLVDKYNHKEVLLLKADIEGYELPMFAAFTEDMPVLPLFIAAEIHHSPVFNVGTGFLKPRDEVVGSGSNSGSNGGKSGSSGASWRDRLRGWGAWGLGGSKDSSTTGAGSVMAGSGSSSSSSGRGAWGWGSNHGGGSGMSSQAESYQQLWGRPGLGQAELGLFFMHMANLGYAVVSREDNPLGQYCCSEYLFMRVEARKLKGAASAGIQSYHRHRRRLLVKE